VVWTARRSSLGGTAGGHVPPRAAPGDGVAHQRILILGGPLEDGPRPGVRTLPSASRRRPVSRDLPSVRAALGRRASFRARGSPWLRRGSSGHRRLRRGSASRVMRPIRDSAMRTVEPVAIDRLAAATCGSPERVRSPVRLPQTAGRGIVDGTLQAGTRLDLTRKTGRSLPTACSRKAALVGAKGIPALEKMLAAKGLLARKEDPETPGPAPDGARQGPRTPRRGPSSSGPPRIRIRLVRQRRHPGAARGGHMTAGGPPKGSMRIGAETVQTTDGFLPTPGRDFLVVLYTACARSSSIRSRTPGAEGAG